MTDLAPGQTYYAEAWVAAVPDAGAPSGVTLGIDVYADGNTLLQPGNPSGPSVAMTWAKGTTLTTVTTDARTQLILSVVAADGDCFIVDDAVVRRQN